MNKRRIGVYVAGLLLGSVLGCGKESSNGGPVAPLSGGGTPETIEKEAPNAKKWDPSAGTAEVKGVVKFSGTAPKVRRLDMGGDPKCSALHPQPALEEFVIVNANGTLKNVFVYVKKGLEGWSFSPPAQGVTLQQHGCMYVPHVLGVQVGQTVLILNEDDLAHNVHGVAGVNGEFNFSQAQKGTENKLVYQYQEVMAKVKCDIHGWMNAWAGVVRHPYFFVTGEDGSFRLPSLSPGEYTIEAWHEKFGRKVATVKVGDKETKELEFTFEGK